MKRQLNHIVIPLQLWEHTDLTLVERCVLIELSTYPQDVYGCHLSDVILSTSLGISKKEVKAALSELIKKKALILTIDGDGRKWGKPMLYQERYLRDDTIVSDIKQKESVKIDYDYIVQKWAEYCPDMPPILRMTSMRKSKIRTLLAKNQATVDDLIKCFRIVGISNFLQNGLDGSWRADFDWIIRDSKGAFTKILEGVYCKTYQEKLEYERIIKGDEISPAEDKYK